MMPQAKAAIIPLVHPLLMILVPETTPNQTILLDRIIPTIQEMFQKVRGIFIFSFFSFCNFDLQIFFDKIQALSGERGSFYTNINKKHYVINSIKNL